MHYLTELANKLVENYRKGNNSSPGPQTEEERQKLVAAIRCALELETGKRKPDAIGPHPVREYEYSEAFAPLQPARKD